MSQRERGKERKRERERKRRRDKMSHVTCMRERGAEIKRETSGVTSMIESYYIHE